MKALTIRQPIASLVAEGVCTILTSTRPTSYRGRIAIHAGKGGRGYFYRRYVDNVLLGSRATETRPRELRLPDGTHVPDPGIDTWPEGAIVATAVLTDVVPMTSTSTLPSSWEEMGARWLWIKRHPGCTSLYLRQRREHAVADEPVTDQLPFGDFAPGRWAWLLDDIKPTRDRCPACWGEGGQVPHPGPICSECGTRPGVFHCSTCKGVRGCEPVPARGRPGLWEWTP